MAKTNIGSARMKSLIWASRVRSCRSGWRKVKRPPEPSQSIVPLDLAWVALYVSPLVRRACANSAMLSLSLFLTRGRRAANQVRQEAYASGQDPHDPQPHPAQPAAHGHQEGAQRPGDRRPGRVRRGRAADRSRRTEAADPPERGGAAEEPAREGGQGGRQEITAALRATE